MENSNIAFVEGEYMILCHTDNAASTELDMPPVETLMEDRFQPMNIDEKKAIDDSVMAR
jgi:hypothetical protein